MAAPVGSSAAEPRAFIEERVRLFVGLLFAFFGATFVFDRVTAFGFHGTFWEHPHPANDPSPHLLAVAVFGALYGWLRTGPIETATSTRVEALATIGAAIALGWMVQPLTATLRPELILLLGMVDILVFRAAIVPSSPRRTAGIGGAVLAVVIVASLAAQGRASTFTPYFVVVGVGVWGGIAVAASTVVASVIYGLRERAREAHELGLYVLGERIGSGGMGAVYRARHAFLRRPTAVKLLTTGHAGESTISRFEREVQRTAALSHPNVVSIYDFGRSPDGAFYYAMELLDGVDLQRVVVESGPQPASRVVHLLRQAAAGLAEAHRRGLVHRDVKPANLIVCRHPRRHDLVKVVDFGLVKEVEGASPDATESASVTLIGTPAYLAPESITDRARAGASVDIYALGAVAYFLLTGTPPFDGGSVVEICGKHLYADVEPPSARLGAPVPSPLEALVLACLAKKPEDRPPSVEALSAALDRCGVGPWTREDARAFWAGRGGPVPAASPEPTSGPRTIAMARREAP